VEVRRRLVVGLTILGLVALLLGSTLLIQVLERRGEPEGEERESETASPRDSPRPPLSVGAGGRGAVHSFDDGPAGAVPEGFVSARTGPGNDGTWRVHDDPTAPSRPRVLAQTSTDSTEGRFPMAVATGDRYEDLELSVRFKSVSGRVDQAGGLVFRYQGPNDYYLVRANALEDNVRLYHVVRGFRTQLSGKDVPVSRGSWHTLKVVCVDSRIEAYFDGQRVIDHDDTTFRGAGLVGVWTKADSVTYFDDLTVTDVGSQ
jgi:hypothetical protein